MAQNVIPLMGDALGLTREAVVIADAARLMMNAVFTPQPVVRTTARTS